MRKLVIALAVVLALPAAAQAGGWATVTLAPPPTDLRADETWTARLTVRRHGVTPTDGATPWITIRNDAHGTKAFAAKPAGTTGVYVARVAFPGTGSWRYEVSDGLAATGYGRSQTHTYAPVEIVPGTVGGGGDGLPVWPLALAAVSLAAAGALVLARQRSRRPAHQS